MSNWTIDEKEVKASVKDALPQGTKVRVFSVHRKTGSGSTQHYVQQVVHKPMFGNREVYNLCDCSGHKFVHPLVILGASRGTDCIHIKTVKSNTKHV